MDQQAQDDAVSPNDDTTSQPSSVQPTPRVDDPWVPREYPCLVMPILNCIFAFIIPGLGNGLTGQVKKGVVMFFFGILCHLIIHLFLLIPVAGIIVDLVLQIVWTLFYRIVAAHDAYVISQRLESAYPIMKGECGNRFAKWGVSWLVKPCFVTDTNEAPTEWVQVIKQ